MLLRNARSLVLCVSAVTLILVSVASAAEAPKTSAELYQETAVWTVHLTFTPDEWTAMEPRASPSTPTPGYAGRGARRS